MSVRATHPKCISQQTGFDKVKQKCKCLHVNATPFSRETKQRWTSFGKWQIRHDKIPLIKTIFIPSLDWCREQKEKQR